MAQEIKKTADIVPDLDTSDGSEATLHYNAIDASNSDMKSSPWEDSSRQEMLAFVPADARRILDVGCNFGGFGRALKARSNPEVWGVEPNPATAAAASKFLDRVINDFFGANISLPDKYFDVIVFNDVLEHMPDPWAALKIAREKLASGGRVVVSIPNLRYVENLLHILKERDFEYEASGIRDKTHLRFFTKKSALRLFEGSGLQVVHLEGINEEWWTPSILRRLSYRFFRNYLDDTRFIQYAIVATEDDPTQIKSRL